MTSRMADRFMDRISVAEMVKGLNFKVNPFKDGFVSYILYVILTYCKYILAFLVPFVNPIELLFLDPSRNVLIREDKESEYKTVNALSSNRQKNSWLHTPSRM
jgi:hypothetical protein